MVTSKVHNKSRQKKKKSYLGFRIAISVFLILLIIFLNIGYNNFKMAAISTAGDCFNYTGDGQYQVAGEVIADIPNGQLVSNNVSDENIKVNIFVDNPEVIRHELCHIHQIKQNRMFSCVIPPLVYLNELECYILTTNEPLTESEQMEANKYLITP